MSRNEIKISVGTLAEEWGLTGDLNRLAGSRNLAHEGIKAHRRIRKNRPKDYETEVPVSYSGTHGGFTLIINGRIDGILPGSEMVLVEEIKTTAYELEGFAKREESVHWAQAKIYAYLYSREKQLERVEVQVTCASLSSRKILEERKVFSFGELEEYFQEITDRLIDWHRRIDEWRKQRDLSLSQVPFPFAGYRKGQREMAIASWRAVKERLQLMVQSPTGTGKTVASLFPAARALPDGDVSRIIFLTARTTGQSAAESCLQQIREKGGRIKSVTLTARDKVCRGEGICTGEECEYARGYYDRLGGALKEFFEGESFNREQIEEISSRHNICPYAFSRELHKWADCVICDLNYVFDPVVAAGAIPADVGNSALIVDEAHNLADRARDNFSATLSRVTLREVKKLAGRRRRLRNLLVKAENHLIEIFTPGRDLALEPDPLFLATLRDLVTEIEKVFLREDNLDNTFRETMFNALCEAVHFIETAEALGPDYKLLLQPGESGDDAPEAAIKLFCIDPARQLKEILDGCHSAVFLSGTLEPINYFRRLIGCRDDAGFLVLPSPYPGDNLATLVYTSLSTRYLDREKSGEHLAGVITSFVNFRKGNNLVFFPSYAYMKMILDLLSGSGDSSRPGIKGDIIAQSPGMDDGERAAFLARFSADNREPLTGMAVLGGVFGEGIDLVGERLNGVVIVGVGLPSLSDEREAIKEYFNERGGSGFNYAYLIPGMTRVLQAAGRLIRSETDRGAVLLIGDRFRAYSYRSLFPAYWQPEYISSLTGLTEALEQFWGK